MADTKISALTASTTPLAGTEVLPIVQSGTTKQVSVANLTAGRAISATQMTLTTGNLIVASGQGIDFSADASAAGMTSELLDDYEEGTWTPAQGGGLVVVGDFSSSGTYTKIGRIVTISGRVQGATSIALTAGGVLTNNIPFGPVSASGTGVAVDSTSVKTANLIVYSGSLNLYSAETTTASSFIDFSLTYMV